jgi:hypothetical protein
MYGGTGHQNDDLRLVSVEEAGCHCRVAGIGELELDGGRPVGPLGKRRRGARNGDHLGAGVGERCSDAVAQAAARANDDRGLSG